MPCDFLLFSTRDVFQWSHLCFFYNAADLTVGVAKLDEIMWN